MDIFYVLNRAKDRSGAKRKADLARMLSVNPQNLTSWFNGHGYPSDPVMIRLCELAEIDQTEGLLLLNTWRSEGKVKETYAALLAQITKTAAAFTLACIIFIIPAPTAEAQVKISDQVNASQHYGKFGTMLSQPS